MITALDKNTALILIDLQKGFAKAKAAHPMPSILEKASELVEAFHKKELPVVAVTVTLNGAKWLERRKDRHRVPKNKVGLALVRALLSIVGFSKIAPQTKVLPSDIFIVKNTPNAFYNTDLQKELKKRNITGIVLAGVSTSSGVEATARAACELGYNISFALDAITDLRAEAHENSVKNIFPFLGETGTVSDILEKIKNRV